MNYPDGHPEEWTMEHEMELPEALRIEPLPDSAMPGSSDEEDEEEETRSWLEIQQTRTKGMRGVTSKDSPKASASTDERSGSPD